jgi:two-component system, sensor histidine kinase YesM
MQKIQSETNDWMLYYFDSINDMTVRARYFTIAMIISVLIAAFLCIVISTLVATFITRRLNVLVAKTNQIGKNHLVADLHLEGKDEIGQIDKNFNNMLNRINDLIEKEYKLTLHVNQTRLELLQEQINPHMLYNTLSMISLVSRQSGEMDILNVSNNLIGFYRGILSKGEIITCIKDEIAMIKMYIEIIKFVYKIDIILSCELDDEILSLYSLKLILQPLVENAIIHGLRPVNGGMIIISGRILGDSICFDISDSGVGIPDDIKKNINLSLNGGTNEKSYGLSNVAKRLNIFFGDAYGISIDSHEGCGTKISISVPALNKDQIDKLLYEKFNI